MNKTHLYDNVGDPSILDTKRKGLPTRKELLLLIENNEATLQSWADKSMSANQEAAQEKLRTQIKVAKTHLLIHAYRMF